MGLITMADQPSYTRVPNTIFDALSELTEVQLKLVLTVIRKTIGWQKECDAISLSQFEVITGLSRPAIVEALKSLVVDGWLAIAGKGKRGTACWACGPRLVVSVNQLTETTSELSLPDLVNSVNRSSPQLVNSVNTQKKDLKERINKESVRKTRTPRTPKQGSLDSLHEACQIAKNAIGKKLTPVQATTIADTVIDLEHWRAVVTAWGNRYGTMNVDGMIDWYLHPDKMRRNDRSNGNGSRPIRQNAGHNFERANWKEGSIDDAI